MLLKNILELLKNKNITILSELKIEAERTNQLLIEIKELLSINISKNDNSIMINPTESFKKKKSKEYIPDPNISNITVSNKEIKEETTESNNIYDTLKSLSKLNL